MSSAVSLGRESFASSRPRRRVLGRPIPAEGEKGLFTQSWFPLCLAREVPPGKVLGVDFLDRFGCNNHEFHSATGILS